jgi:hypothetical protein
MDVDTRLSPGRLVQGTVIHLNGFSRLRNGLLRLLWVGERGVDRGYLPQTQVPFTLLVFVSLSGNLRTNFKNVLGVR